MNDRKLPVHGHEPEAQENVCSPTAYVSNEESAIVTAMRRLKDRASEIRERLETECEGSIRTRLEHELDSLRAEFAELAERREAAYRRKMVMLGHLPPEALLE